jgi:hypothetical protein
VIGFCHEVTALLVALALGLALAGHVENDEAVLAGHRLGWGCAFRTRTGQPCASCGLTRGWVHMAHARIDAARAANRAAPLTFLAACFFVIGTVALRVLGARQRDLARVLLFLVLVASFGGVLVRNIALRS